jgi:hypothetical protein
MTPLTDQQKTIVGSVLIEDISSRRYLSLHVEGSHGEHEGFKFRIVSNCGCGGIDLYCHITQPNGQTRIFRVSGQELLVECMDLVLPPAPAPAPVPEPDDHPDDPPSGRPADKKPYLDPVLCPYCGKPLLLNGDQKLGCCADCWRKSCQEIGQY